MKEPQTWSSHVNKRTAHTHFSNIHQTLTSVIEKETLVENRVPIKMFKSTELT